MSRSRNKENKYQPVSTDNSDILFIQLIQLKYIGSKLVEKLGQHGFLSKSLKITLVQHKLYAHSIAQFALDVQKKTGTKLSDDLIKILAAKAKLIPKLDSGLNKLIRYKVAILENIETLIKRDHNFGNKLHDFVENKQIDPRLISELAKNKQLNYELFQILCKNPDQATAIAKFILNRATKTLKLYGINNLANIKALCTHLTFAEEMLSAFTTLCDALKSITSDITPELAQSYFNSIIHQGEFANNYVNLRIFELNTTPKNQPEEHKSTPNKKTYFQTFYSPTKKFLLFSPLQPKLPNEPAPWPTLSERKIFN